jgi:N6-L-threonylcarbamoyladenine synthase
MKILAIETSCDETSVAIVEDGHKLHSLVVNSQIDLHRAFGGVVPEVAARSHIEVMIPVVQQGLDEAKMTWDEIDAIAVTQGPGLLGALLIGVLTARTLAWSLNKPLYAVHHIMGHAYANWIHEGKNLSQPYTAKDPEFPVLALIVSGNHCQLMYATDHTNWKVIGRTQDDAVGEAFDKAARVIGLPYPGGPSIEKAARDGDPKRYTLPTPRVSEKYNFSFSGLKTAFLRAVQTECSVDINFPSFELAGKLNKAQVADFAASFEHTAVNYMVSKTKLAFDEFQPKTVIIGGGVAASPALRQELANVLPIEIDYAPQILCTDNAAMIGARAYFQSKSDNPVDPRSLDPVPSWPL